MKLLVRTACAAALICLSNNICAAQVNGINYDPGHNPEWTTAQGKNQVLKMQQIVKSDLAQIKNMGFNTIKTYYSIFCPQNGQNCINIADFANSAGLKVMLGVFEFTQKVYPPNQSPCNPESECVNWTVGQVNGAISQGNASSVIGIVVGNEDMFDYAGNPWVDMQTRIVADINTIKRKVNVPVTTAQRQPDWCGGPDPGCASDRTNSLNQVDPAGVLKSIPVIAVNIFLYWAPNFIPEKTACEGNKSAALCTQNTAQNVLNAVKKVAGTTVKNVIVGEEGWPSCYSNGSQHQTDITLESDYYTNWQKHQFANGSPAIFDSYYFMAYDLGPSATCPTPNGADANTYFGLCNVNGATKTGLAAKCY